MPLADTLAKTKSQYNTSLADASAVAKFRHNTAALVTFFITTSTTPIPRSQARAQGKAEALLNSSQLCSFRLALDQALVDQTLSPNPKLNPKRDVGLRAAIAQLLTHSYQPDFLSLALQTMYSSSQPAPALIQHKLLQSAPSTSSSDPPSALACFTRSLVRDFLVLVLFLDYLRQDAVLAHACLFEPTSAFKSTHAVALHFSALVLASHTPLPSALHKLGFPLSDCLFAQSRDLEFVLPLPPDLDDRRTVVALARALGQSLSPRGKAGAELVFDMCWRLGCEPRLPLSLLHKAIQRFAPAVSPSPDLAGALLQWTGLALGLGSALPDFSQATPDTLARLAAVYGQPLPLLPALRDGRPEPRTSRARLCLLAAALLTAERETRACVTIQRALRSPFRLLPQVGQHDSKHVQLRNKQVPRSEPDRARRLLTRAARLQACSAGLLAAAAVLTGFRDCPAVFEPACVLAGRCMRPGPCRDGLVALQRLLALRAQADPCAPPCFARHAMLLEKALLEKQTVL